MVKKFSKNKKGNDMANYITKEGMLQLKNKMQLLIAERPSIIKQVVTAREMGDLSENAEYHAARERQRNLENDYNRLKSRIEKLQVLDISKIAKDTVRFGARVTVKELATGKTKKLFLVGIDEIYETKDDYERTSVLSPIGKAMIGKKVGNDYIVKAPVGDKHFKILEII